MTTLSPPRRENRLWLVVRDWRGLASAGYLVVLVALALLAPVVTAHEPNAQNFDAILAPAGTPGYLLGSDDLGRDVLSRLIHGAQASLLASFLAVGVALLIGIPLGLAAGYLGGIVDSAVMRVVDTLLSFPAIILAIAITAALQPSLVNSMISVGIVFAPSVARLMRAQVLAVKEETYVEAARSFGSRGRHLVLRHLVPNSIQPVLVQSSLLLAHALIAEASLSFLGLGVQPPDPSWGSMLARAYTFLYQAPLQMLVPGIAIAATALAFNVLGDVAQQALDPRRNR
ncbi:ABC transporter permease [Saccharopolyspora sp. NPDC050642]|jgi:peptide/nickel transport system permease protein|uniref:ABC transporter permease n=1 Tax=unclassified Saccharopolyspora TaxID=2646250 RepID=UPI0033CD4927